MSIDELGRLKFLMANTSIGVPYMTETWQFARVAIDAAVWTKVITAAGTITDPPDLTEEPYQKVVLGAAANADAARIHTVHEWQLAPDLWAANTFNRILIMEWEAKFVEVDDINENSCLMGLTALPLATRLSDDIACFIIVTDALNVITDTGAAETVTVVPSAPALTAWHKYAIVSYRNAIEFWVDEVMEVRHTTTPAPDQDLPDINAHGNFFITNSGGVAECQMHIGTVNIRPGVLL